MNYTCSYCGANICSDKECINCGAKSPNPLKVENLIQLLIAKANNHPSISDPIKNCLSGAKEAANNGRFSASIKLSTPLLNEQQYFLRDKLRKMGFSVEIYSKEIDLSWGPTLMGY